MMQTLIDPMIEYSDLTQRDKIEALDEAVRVIIRISKRRTIEYFFSPDQGQKELIANINSLTSDAVKLSLFGTLTYRRQDFKANVAKRKWYEYLIMAARNYQKVYELSRRIPNQVTNNNLYMYLFMSAAEFHNALQHACSKSLVKDASTILESLDQGDNGVAEQTNRRLHQMLLHFLGGNFRSLRDEIPAFLYQLKSIVSTNDDFSHSELLDLTCIIHIVASLDSLTRFVLAGNKADMEESLKSIASAHDAADKSGRPDLRYIADKLTLSLRTLKDLSLWNLDQFFQLGEDSFKLNYLTQYIRSKIENDFYFLYPSQYEALQAGILDRKARRILVSTPTGAGKTFLAELVVISEKLHSSDQKAISLYMVPSRALAREKFDAARNAFDRLAEPSIRVCQITGEILLDAEQAIEENDVVILTPEKFDMILRNRFYEKVPDVLVIDEFHNISGGYRGIRIQFAMIRFRQLYPKAKIVLISAMMSNFDEIKKWFQSDKDFQTTWKPTFSRIGIFDIRDPSGIIKFTDGISVEVAFERKFRSNAYMQQAAGLATQFSQEGPCLIFSSDKDSVATYADYLVEEKTRDPKTTIDTEVNSKMALRLKRIIGEEEQIYKYFIKGIGVHRGDLPHVIRRIIEDAVRKSAISLLVSTTTLAEGINLPLKTIIIPKPEVGGDALTFSLFFNLFGRAGRPSYETEGQVVFLVRRDFPLEILEKYQKARPKDIERIATPIMLIIRLEERLEKPLDLNRKQRFTDDMVLFEATLDSALLALIAEKVIATIQGNQDLLDKIIIDPLVSNEATRIDREKVAAVLEKSQNRLLAFQVLEKANETDLTITQFGLAVYKTGFSPRSCFELMKMIPKLCNRLDGMELNRGNILRVYDAIAEIFGLMRVPLETKPYFMDELPSSYPSIMLDWMRGKLLSDIASSYFGRKLSKALISVDGLLSGYSAWFLYALWILAEFHLQLKDPKPGYVSGLEALSRYSYYGTDDKTALRLMSLDISRELYRDDVLKMISGLTREEVNGILRNPEGLRDGQIREKIGSLGLSDDEEFVETMHRILSKPSATKQLTE
jgi:superfamily II DNA/RNA helicase